MVLNIAAYRFVSIADPAALRDQWRPLLEAADLRGTVLVASEGVNLFLAGEAESLRGFLDYVQKDPRFSGLGIKESWSDTVPFARLKVKLKREIIAFRRESVDPVGAPAPTVAPEALARWLAQGHDDSGRPLLLLDTRNREEVAFGTFRGALTLPIDDFVALPEAVAASSERFSGRTVVSFCTGGIRCEKAAPWLRDQGFGDVYQLEGGILGYFERVGSAHYDGACFVFDQRVALTPDLRPLTLPR